MSREREEAIKILREVHQYLSSYSQNRILKISQFKDALVAILKDYTVARVYRAIELLESEQTLKSPLEYPWQIHIAEKTKKEFYDKLRLMLPEDLFNMKEGDTMNRVPNQLHASIYKDESEPEPIYECPKCKRFYQKEMICPYCADVMVRSAKSKDIIDRLTAENKDYEETCKENQKYIDELTTQIRNLVKKKERLKEALNWLAGEDEYLSQKMTEINNIIQPLYSEMRERRGGYQLQTEFIQKIQEIGLEEAIISLEEGETE